MEACTITALDVIAAFVAPNPDCPSQSRRFFRVQSPAGLPTGLITQPTSDWPSFNLGQSEVGWVMGRWGNPAGE